MGRKKGEREKRRVRDEDERKTRGTYKDQECVWVVAIQDDTLSHQRHTWRIMTRQTPAPSSEGGPYIPVITYTMDWPMVINIPNTMERRVTYYLHWNLLKCSNSTGSQ